MAIVNSFSTALGNTYNGIYNPARLVKGVGGPFIGLATIAPTDNIGSTYRLGRVKSSSRVSFGQLASDSDTASTTAVNIGLYQPTTPGSLTLGAVVNATFFAAALPVHAANVVQQCYCNAGGTVVAQNLDQFIWQQLGLPEDPQQVYDVVATISATATNGTCQLALQMWPIDDQ